MTAATKTRSRKPETGQPAKEQTARNTIKRYALNPDDELMLLRMVGLEPTPGAVKRSADQRAPKKQFEPKPTTEPDPTLLEGRPSLPCGNCGREMFKQTWPGPWKWDRISHAGHGYCHRCRNTHKPKTEGARP
ncbi:hypothetical protein [Nocardia farcinica]|uniref:hypothetical protein n=1 Tax=Nocardia farcinica TaxID=37329 RepID=UPI002458A2D9|nr:hypothetical protein [Nocardia farcinica]